MLIKCTHTITLKALDLLSQFPLSLLSPMCMAREEEKKYFAVHDKMFRLGEVRVLIIVPRDMSRKILWTMHIDHTCMHAVQQHKAGLQCCSCQQQQQGLHPCTDAMERHITDESLWMKQLKTAKPNKGPGLLVLCVSVSPLVFVLYFLLSLAVSEKKFCIAVVLTAGYLTWQATTSL